MKFSKIFPWKEFYDRYINNFEEFTLIYNGETISLITDPKGFLYTLKTKDGDVITSKIYNSPTELLENASFNGKKLKEIWDQLE